MKKIWTAVTAVLAVLVLAAGAALLPTVYSAVFDAEKVVYEEDNLPEELSAAPAAFMDRFRYPLSEETVILPEADREARMCDSRALLGEEVYERTFRMVGLEESDSYWHRLSSLPDGSIYLIQVPAEKEGEEYVLSVAMDEEMLPFLACRRRKQEPSETEVQEAAETLSGLCEAGEDSLRLYTEEIDQIYENCQVYWNHVVRLYSSLLPEDGTAAEISDRVPLWECCRRGEWQVCRDSGEAVLVCVMGQGSLVLYYDAVEKEFCGFRIQFAED